MALTLRPTGLSPPAYHDWLDYMIVENGCKVGRIYENRNGQPEQVVSLVHQSACRSEAGIPVVLTDGKTRLRDRDPIAAQLKLA